MSSDSVIPPAIVNSNRSTLTEDELCTHLITIHAINDIYDAVKRAQESARLTPGIFGDATFGDFDEVLLMLSTRLYRLHAERVAVIYQSACNETTVGS